MYSKKYVYVYTVCIFFCSDFQLITMLVYVTGLIYGDSIVVIFPFHSCLFFLIIVLKKLFFMLLNVKAIYSKLFVDWCCKFSNFLLIIKKKKSNIVLINCIFDLRMQGYCICLSSLLAELLILDLHKKHIYL